MTGDPAFARPSAGPDLAHIGHVELLTPRLDASVACFTEVLGMSVVAAEGESVYLRGESEYERYGLKLTDSPDAGISHLAIRTRSGDALERRAAALEAAGVSGGWIDGDIGHGPAYAFRAPSGHLIELYWETERFVPEPAAAGETPLARDRLGARGGRGRRRAPPGSRQSARPGCPGHGHLRPPAARLLPV